jgi:hypothetical protein
MPVYVLRESISNNFKIGRTSGTIDGVIKRLRTGNPRPLKQFAVIETDQESACEAFFHRHLKERRVVLGGGVEFFEFDPIEMQAVVDQTQRMFEERSEIRQIVEELKSEPSNDTILEPNEEDREIMGRLLLIEKEKELLTLESEMLKGKLMKRIGMTSGIRGIATWKTQVTRVYDEDLFRNSDPERYQELLEKYYCLDTGAWKADRPDDYKEVQTTYFTPRIGRTFRLQKMD